MGKESLRGVPLERFRDPIIYALTWYETISEGHLSFERAVASHLVPTPTKPNSARSETVALYDGKPIGKFFVIVFQPYDGTGSEEFYNLRGLIVDSPYPIVAKIVPRNKTGFYNEAHLTIVTHEIDSVHADPILFAGTFDLLGLEGHRVKRVGTLGHGTKDDNTQAVATLTTGYKDGLRIGDPHAVFNTLVDTIQVCAFLGVTEDINKQFPEILNTLKPQFPIAV